MKPAKKYNWINFVILGIFLVGLAIGGLFSIQLVRYNFSIFIVVTLISIFYINRSLVSYFKGKKLTKVGVVYGFLALFLIMLSFGIQARQIPFKEGILILGLVLLCYGIYKKLY